MESFVAAPRPAQMTFTLPHQYRPRYADALLQSSSEQDPFQPFDAQSESSPAQPLPPPSRTYKIPSAFRPSYEHATAPWGYRASRPMVQEQTFHTLPRNIHAADYGGWPWRGSEESISLNAFPSFSQAGDFPSELSINEFEPPRLLISPTSPVDFFIPHFRQSKPAPFGFDDSPQSSISTVWRGLSVSDAQELFFWFKLYEQVTQKWDETTILPTSIPQIASEMVEHAQDMTGQQGNWVLTSPDPRGFLSRLLSSSSDQPFIKLCGDELPIVGRACTLSPRLFSMSQCSAKFSTTASWLKFDRSANCFRGVVPQNCRFELITKITHYLDGDKRREQTIRSQIDLRVSHPSPPLQSTIPFPDANVLGVKPAKRVTFADESEAGSIDSSPAHLRPFLNGLSEMTCDPAHLQNPLTTSNPPDDHADNVESLKADDTSKESSENPSHNLVTAPTGVKRRQSTREASVVHHGLDETLSKWRWKGWEREVEMKRKAAKSVESIRLTGYDWKGWEDKIIAREMGRDPRAVYGTPQEYQSWLQSLLGDSSASASPLNSLSGSNDTTIGLDASDMAPTTSSRSSVTLYDSVRNQFRNDHQARQTLSIRIPKNKGKRPALQLDPVKNSRSSWSSDSLDGDDEFEGYPTPTESEASISSSVSDTDSQAGSDMIETAGGQDPDFDSIAAALQRSFNAEVYAEHDREEQEIRKGILQHEVMDVRRAQRQRQFGSSNYEDLFWSSGSATPASGSQDAD